MTPNGPDNKKVKVGQAPHSLVGRSLPQPVQASVASEKTGSPLAEGPNTNDSKEKKSDSGKPELEAALAARGYELLKELGRGGMGIVYKAYYIPLKRYTAIKTLTGDAVEDSLLRRRFINEALVLARKDMQHPNIVGVYDLIYTPETEEMEPKGPETKTKKRGPKGPIYIVMEYIEESKTYGRLIGEDEDIPLRRSLLIFDQICNGLMKAHRAGIVHRDIKPDNILIVPDEDGEIVKLIDFGIAKIKNSAAYDKTKTGTIMGSPQYLSPEQVKGANDIDYRTDVYSLGVVMYEGLGKKMPFEAPEVHSILYKIIYELPPQLPEGCAPPEVIRIVMQCLEKDPAARPSLREIKEVFAQVNVKQKNQAGAEPEVQIVATSLPTEQRASTPDQNASLTIGPYTLHADTTLHPEIEMRKKEKGLSKKSLALGLGSLVLVAGLSFGIPRALKRQNVAHQTTVTATTPRQIAGLPVMRAREPQIERPLRGSDAGQVYSQDDAGSAIAPLIPQPDAASVNLPLEPNVQIAEPHRRHTRRVAEPHTQRQVRPRRNRQPQQDPNDPNW